MPRKTSDQHQANSRLGALGESLVQTFLLEYADFCYPTQEKHPADLMVEFGSAKYTVQVKSRTATIETKFVFAAENFWGRTLAAISSSTDPSSYEVLFCTN